MRNDVVMEVDIRKHPPLRQDVRSGLKTLLVQARQIWGDREHNRHTLDEIVVRLMVGVGDLARVTRGLGMSRVQRAAHIQDELAQAELKKELGNVLFSTIRWIDDLGLDPLECLDLAILAQEKFVDSDRTR